MEAEDGSDGDASSTKQRELCVFHNVAPPPRWLSFCAMRLLVCLSAISTTH